MNPLLVGIVLYIAVQILIGVVVSRRIASEDDYLLAGRRFGYGLATFSIFATWFGAETCVDAAGHVYRDGLSFTSTEPYAYAVALVLTGLLLAAPLYSARLTTLADLYRARYSRGVERATALVMIPSSVFWAAAQIRAFGHVLSNASELTIVEGTAIATGVVILYTAFGGLLADAVTDVIQGVALVVGLLVMLLGIAGDLGGLGAAARSIDTSLLRFAPADNPGWLDLAEAWAPPVLGSFVAQELISRISASRSLVVARRSTIAGGLAYALVGSIPVVLGLLGASLAVQVDDPEQILPHLAKERLSLVGYTLFSGALVSAILSTVDSTLLVASSLVSHNLVLPLRPGMSERGKVRLARAGVTFFGLVAFLLALTSDSVADLIDVTNGFGSSGLCVMLLFGLFTRFGGPASAFAALFLGAALYLAGSFLDWSHTYLLALAGALAGYVLFAGFERRATPPARGY